MNCRKGICKTAGTGDRVWALLLDLSFNRAQRHFEAAVAEFDLAPAQAMALHELDPSRSISMRELATRLHCDPSNITGLTDRLEMRGLVELRSAAGDRRVKSLALTPTGEALRERLTWRLYQAPSFLARLSPARQKTLLDLLQAILEDTAEEEAPD